MWRTTSDIQGTTIKVVSYNVLASVLEDLHTAIEPEKRHFDYRKVRIVRGI